MKGLLSVIIVGGAVYLIITGYYGIAGVLVLATLPVLIQAFTGLAKSRADKTRNIRSQLEEQAKNTNLQPEEQPEKKDDDEVFYTGINTNHTVFDNNSTWLKDEFGFGFPYSITNPAHPLHDTFFPFKKVFDDLDDEFGLGWSITDPAHPLHHLFFPLKRDSNEN